MRGGARPGSGAPEGNQNGLTHGLTSDLDNYFANASPEDRAWMTSVMNVIVDRITEHRDPDAIDWVLARRLAIRLHIAARASAWIAEEDEPLVPIWTLLRQYDKSIFKDLADIGAIPLKDGDQNTSK